MLISNILDTLKIENGSCKYKKFHIARLLDTYDYLKINVSKDEIENIYQKIETEFSNNIVRLIFSDKKLELISAETKPNTETPQLLKLHSIKSQQDQFNNYKWQNRDYWNNLLVQKNANSDDILTITLDNQICETSIFNIFIKDNKKQMYYTPTLATGCLNGVFRRHVLENKLESLPVIEKNIELQDIHQYELFVGNSVRGVIKAQITYSF